MKRGWRRAALALALGTSCGRAAACDTGAFGVALDIGHYRAAPGAVSATGVAEFDYNLALARQVLSALQRAGFARAFLIGESGAPLTLADRTRIAAQADARLFLSLHHDSVQPHYLSEWLVAGKPQRYSDLYRGYAIFVSAKSAQASRSIEFARLLGTYLRAQGLTPSLYHAEAIPGENRPLLDARLGIHRFDNLAVLRTATMPAVLLESGVIVNRQEEMAAADGSRGRHVAQAVTAAVTGMCGSMTDGRAQRTVPPR